jgi:hypothetical protein
MRISVAVSATYNLVYVMPQLFKLKTLRRNRLAIRSLKMLAASISSYDRRERYASLCPTGK